MGMLEAGIANNSENFHRMHAGMGGFDVYEGFAQFTTTGATLAIPIPIRRIKSLAIAIVGTPASDEVVSANHAADVTSDGHEIQLTAAATGGYTLNLIRTGSVKTSGLIVSLRVIGYP